MTDVVFEFKQPKGKKDVALTDGFIDALFSISEKIHTSEKFRVRSNGSSRLLWHITEADLMLMVTLHVCFNSQGKIQNVSRHQIYQKLRELYEDPCCDDQFYIAFEKFVKLGLIEEKVSGVISEYSMNHFINLDTNKVSRLVVVNPFIFSKGFTDLPISAQKFVFDLLRKKGNEKGKEVFYWLDKGRGILQLLHKKHVYELKNILKLLSEKFHFPLVKSWKIEGKKGTSLPKLTVTLNESYTSRYVPGTQYRDVIPGKRTYRRVISHLQKLLTANMIGEFEFLNNGNDFYQLVRLLRGKSYKFMAYVVEKIREIYEKNRVFPNEIVDFVKDEIRHKAMITYLEIAKRTGVYKFISPRKFDDTRLFEFASAASFFSQRKFTSMCLKSLRGLEMNFTRPPAKDHRDYAKSRELESSLDTLTIRDYAFSLKKCPEHYHELEIQALLRLKQGHKRVEVRDWLFKKIELLPKWTLIPDVPPDFKLEEYIFISQCSA